MESNKRTCVKISIWAILAFTTTMLASYCIEHKFDTSVKIAVLDMCMKVILHSIYERVWVHIDWNRTHPNNNINSRITTLP
jgi:uncharacterized membrane protein